MPKPLHQPTEKTRKEVETLSGFGVPQDDIAVLLEISDKTLRKYYPNEIAKGIAKANARVGQTLFQQATSGNNTAATIFWLKARAGWREKHDVDVTIHTDPDALTDAQLAAIASRGSRKVIEAEAEPVEPDDLVH